MIPFSPPYINPTIIAEVVEALESGWITTGPKTKELERELAAFTQAQRVLCLNSATAGMELILRWFGVKEGDEVIVPAYTYTATASVVLHCGATPIMVDVRQDDLTIDAAAIAAAITPRTKVIIPVDLGGMPAHYTDIRTIIEARKDIFCPESDAQTQLGRILLMADAAHSVGAIYEGKPAVLATDIAVYSFHAVKNLTTAEGGAIAFHLPNTFIADDVYAQLYRTSLHGQTKDALAKVGKNAWEYDITEAGYKCNMPDVLAAIGLAGMREYPEMLKRRREIFDAYSQLFNQYDWAETPIYSHSNNTVSSYHLYLLRIKNVSLAERNELIRLIFEQEVSVNVHYKPLPLLTVYKKLGYNIADYPVAQAEWERVITLPVYYQLSDAAIKTVVEAVANAVKMLKG